MKRKEPRGSIVGTTCYENDDKGKQQEIFCERWKQEI